MPKGVQGFQKGHEPISPQNKPGRHRLTNDEVRIGGQRSKRKTVSVEKIREFCIDAMVTLGRDGKGAGGALGYIQKFAKDEPKAFMTSIVAKLIPQQIKADITHDFDVDGAITALERSIDGLLAEDAIKDVTPQITAGSAECADENLVVLVEAGTNGA